MVAATYRIAQRLDQQGLAATHLTEPEYKHFSNALSDAESWNRFISLADVASGECFRDQPYNREASASQGSAPQTPEAVTVSRHETEVSSGQETPLQTDGVEQTESVNGDVRVYPSDNPLVSVIAAYRARSFIYEQLLSSIYPSSKECCHMQQKDVSSAQDSLDRGVGDIFEPFDVFYTVEHDLPAMIEQQKLEDSERQHEEGPQDVSVDRTSTILDASNLSLKYLLTTIANNREATSLSDKELRKLFSDVKPHRSKWANEGKVGQEELYEACEKVLTDLKNYTAHSTPFLTKVSRRDAPDYFEVIKHPMDLSLVTKKLKACQYKSKQAFADDVYLIYENCLVYNTNPASEYRKHAIAMRKKTDKLLANVPDILVRERSEVETEEDADADSDENEAEEHGASRKMPGTSKHLKSDSSKNRGSVEPASAAFTGNDGSTPASTSVANSAIEHLGDNQFRDSSATPVNDSAPSMDTSQILANGIISDAESALPSSVHHTPSAMKTVLQQQESTLSEGLLDLSPLKSANDETELELNDKACVTWIETTKRTRARVCLSRGKQLKGPFGQANAIVRYPKDAADFVLLQHNHDRFPPIPVPRRKPRDPHRADTFYDSDSDDDLDGKRDPAESADLFLPEYTVGSGYPELWDLLQTESKTLREQTIVQAPFLRSEKLSLEDVDPEVLEQELEASEAQRARYSRSLFPNQGIAAKMEDNIELVKNIREIYQKILPLKANLPSNAPPAIDSPEPASADDMMNNEHDDNIEAPLNKHTSIELSKVVMTKMLAHAGFEATQGEALQIITEVFQDYVMNLGKTLRTYIDSYKTKMSFEESLLHVLFENGAQTLDDLEYYVRNDVEKYGQKLQDIQRKLETSFADLVNGNDGETIDDEQLFGDEDMFASGALGEELGEDFFGFKDLGLESELRGALTVPSRVWFGTSKPKARPTNSVRVPALEYPPRPPFTPITQTEGIIGLLKPFFNQKLERENPLTEDEFKPTRFRNRPRLPPTGKNSQASKKQRQKEEEMRKRKKMMMEAAQADRDKKRKEKLEQKAQKQAEKEEKKRLREETKERERKEKQQKMDAKKVR